MTKLATIPELLRLERKVDGLIQAWLTGPLTGDAAARAYDRNIRPLIRQIRLLYLAEKRRKS